MRTASPQRAGQLDSQPVSVTLIVNRSSGVADKQQDQDEVASILQSGGMRATVLSVPENGDPGTLAREAVARGEPMVVASGGDGTISAVASALAGTGVALGVIPSGTLNHFAKDLGLPLDISSAARVLLEGQPRNVDLGEVNGRFFINNSSLGLYANLVANRVFEQSRGRRKWIAFVHALFTVFRRFPFLGVRIETEDGIMLRSTPFVFVGNNQYTVEGLDAGTRTRLDAGFLWLYVAPEGMSRRALLRLAFRSLAGSLRLDRDFQPLRMERFSIDTRRRRVHVARDGEVAMMQPPLQYRIHPRILRVMVPA